MQDLPCMQALHLEEKAEHFCFLCMQAAPSPPPPSKKIIEQVVSAPQKKFVSKPKKSSSQAEVLVSGG